MKVWELMAQLAKSPAGAEVSAVTNGEEPKGFSIDLLTVEDEAAVTLTITEYEE